MTEHEISILFLESSATDAKRIKDELGDFSIGEDLFYPDYYEDWKRLFEVKPILATNSELERK